MKPEQFIREYGVEKAREVVEGAPEGTTHYDIPFEVYLRSTEFWNGSEWKEVDNLTIQDLELPPFVNLSDLKRLVESLDLVEYHGGFDGANRYLDSISSDAYSWNSNVAKYHGKLERAIAVHESIYGGGHV